MKSGLKIAIAILCVFVFKQTATAQIFKGGALLGLNATQVSGDNLGGYNKVGITGGAFVSARINENSKMEMRIMYSPKGSRDVPNYEKGKYTAYYLKLNYLEVPLLYQYKYKSFWLIAGLSGGYLLNSSIANESGPFPQYSLENRPFNKYELSTQFGVAYELDDNWQIEFHSADTFPLLPVRKHASNRTYLLNFGQLNSAISLCVKYTFGKPNE